MGSLRTLVHNPMPRQKRRKKQPPKWHLEAKKRITAAMGHQFPDVPIRIEAQRWKTVWQNHKVSWKRVPTRLHAAWDSSVSLPVSSLIKVICRDVTKIVCYEMGVDYHKLIVSSGQYEIEIRERS
jgi:hypothetical protein